MEYIYHLHPHYYLDSIRAMERLFAKGTPDTMMRNFLEEEAYADEKELKLMLNGLTPLYERVRESVDLKGDMADVLFRERNEMRPLAYLFFCYTQYEDREPGNKKLAIYHYLTEFSHMPQDSISPPEDDTEEAFWRWLYAQNLSTETKVDTARVYMEFPAYERYMAESTQAVTDILCDMLPVFQDCIDQAAKRVREGLTEKGDILWEELFDVRLDDGGCYDIYFSIAGVNGLSVETHGQSQIISFGVGLLQLIAIKDRIRREGNLLEEFLKAVSDGTKLAILKLLKERRHYGVELAEKTGLTAATISHHMNALANLRIINFEKQGARAYYDINTTQIELYLQELHRILCE